MRVVVTGAAGFIGSNLCDALLADGHDVVGLDNLSTGRREFLADAAAETHGSSSSSSISSTRPTSPTVVAGADAVVHLAANADVRFGWDAPRRDLEQNVIVTHNVLEAARRAGVGRFVFSSTGSVYGEAPVIPTPEDCPFPRADVAVRRVQAGRRGVHPGVRRGRRAVDDGVPVRLQPRPALHPRSRHRLRPQRCGRSRRG